MAELNDWSECFSKCVPKDIRSDAIKSLQFIDLTAQSLENLQRFLELVEVGQHKEVNLEKAVSMVDLFDMKTRLAGGTRHIEDGKATDLF